MSTVAKIGFAPLAPTGSNSTNLPQNTQASGNKFSRIPPVQMPDGVSVFQKSNPLFGTRAVPMPDGSGCFKSSGQRPAPMPDGNSFFNPNRSAKPLLSDASNSVTPRKIDFRFGIPPSKVTTPAPAPQPNGVTAQQSNRVTVDDLKRLNPELSKDSLRELDSRSIDMFSAPSEFVRPLEGTAAQIVTKPVSLGSGMFLPVGTKIYPASGIKNTYTQPGLTPQINAQLPNGKILTLESGIDKTTAIRTTKVTFDDGKSIALVGVPFFNPKTGELGRVNKSSDFGDASDKTYKLRNTMFDSAAVGMGARDGRMSGAEAKESLQRMLK